MSAFGLEADPELQTKLSANASQTLRRSANQRLFGEGDQCDGVYLVRSGALRLSLETSPGKTIMTRVVGQGYVVGLPATIHGCQYSLSCDVVEDAELAYISRSSVMELIQSDTNVAVKLLDLLSSEVQTLRTVLGHPLRSTQSSRTRAKKGGSR